MAAKCSSVCVPLERLGRRAVVGKFDGGRMSSDAGAVLLRSANTVFNVIGRVAGCFSDHREAGRVEHPVEALIGQRVSGLALGYEDLNGDDRPRPGHRHEPRRLRCLGANLVARADRRANRTGYSTLGRAGGSATMRFAISVGGWQAMSLGASRGLHRHGAAR